MAHRDMWGGFENSPDPWIQQQRAEEKQYNLNESVRAMHAQQAAQMKINVPPAPNMPNLPYTLTAGPRGNVGYVGGSCTGGMRVLLLLGALLGVGAICVVGVLTLWIFLNRPTPVQPATRLFSPYKTERAVIGGRPVRAEFFKASDLNAFPYERVKGGQFAPPLKLPMNAVIEGDLDHVSLQTFHSLSVHGNVSNCIIATSSVRVDVSGSVASTTIGTAGGVIHVGDVIKSELNGKSVEYASIDTNSMVNHRHIKN